jgi:carbohydrate-binding DOMON domain-containing protein
MAYNNQNQGNKESGYKRELDMEIWKGSVKSDKRFINVQVASYNGGAAAIRLRPCAKNTNPDAEQNKKWINLPGINGITKDEATQLIKVLGDAIKEF